MLDCHDQHHHGNKRKHLNRKQGAISLGDFCCSMISFFNYVGLCDKYQNATPTNYPRQAYGIHSTGIVCTENIVFPTSRRELSAQNSRLDKRKIREFKSHKVGSTEAVFVSCANITLIWLNDIWARKQRKVIFSHFSQSAWEDVWLNCVLTGPLTAWRAQHIRRKPPALSPLWAGPSLQQNLSMPVEPI